MKPADSLGVNADNITEAVAGTFYDAKDARLRVLLSMLVHHLHTFARETRLTQEEWQAAIAFLTRCGQITTQERNEFTLLSDILGLSSLVDLMTHAPEATPGSVLGPFHNSNSDWRENGVDLVGTQPGEPVLFEGLITDTAGAPLPGAEIDFWQNADNALYPAQDAKQDPQNLRCRIKAGADGRFSLRTVRPRDYTVPYDGPVGGLLTAAGRHCWRPAHFHLIIAAPGHRPLVTEIFPRGDQTGDGDRYLHSDAVFGVRAPLVVGLQRASQPGATAAWRATYTFKLARL